jgi:hypothetical protein
MQTVRGQPRTSAAELTSHPGRSGQHARLGLVWCGAEQAASRTTAGVKARGETSGTVPESARHGAHLLGPFHQAFVFTSSRLPHAPGHSHPLTDYSGCSTGQSRSERHSKIRSAPTTAGQGRLVSLGVENQHEVVAGRCPSADGQAVAIPRDHMRARFRSPWSTHTGLVARQAKHHLLHGED